MPARRRPWWVLVDRNWGAKFSKLWLWSIYEGVPTFDFSFFVIILRPPPPPPCFARSPTVFHPFPLFAPLLQFPLLSGLRSSTLLLLLLLLIWSRTERERELIRGPRDSRENEVHPLHQSRLISIRYLAILAWLARFRGGDRFGARC